MGLYNAVEVQILKMAVCNIESVGLSGSKVLLNSIIWLRERYEATNDKKYLKKAVQNMYAYLEQGYAYETEKKEFQIVLDYLGIQAEEVFSPTKYHYKKVTLSNTNIRNLLGRWNPRFHCMKINDVVWDIIDKVSNKKEGTYQYYSGKIITQEGEDTLWEQTYKLYIQEGAAVFHDVNKNKYYTLM